MDIADLGRRLERLDRIAQIWDGLLDGLRPLGLEFAIYTTLADNRTRPYFLTNVPSIFGGMDPADDPFLQHGCIRYGVLRTGVGYLNRNHFLTETERGLLRRASEAGWQTGLGLAVRLIGTERYGGFNFGSRMPVEAFEAEVIPRAGELQVLCLLLNRRIEEIVALGQDEAGLKRLKTTGPAEEAIEALSAREREVILLLGNGMTRKECARLCNLSPHTVAEYSKNAYRKLGVRNRIEAAQRLKSGF